MADDGSDSDEWGMEELVIPPKGVTVESTTTNEDNDDGMDDDDENWAVKRTESNTDKNQQQQKKIEKEEEEGQPMIIVDITQINENVHSRYDRNSVNDATGASQIRKTIESKYEEYSKNSSLIANGTVIPCSTSVWKDALIRLRDERVGHYFIPIFPPKKK